MTLWVDKYKPKKFDDLDYHKEQASYLKHLVHREDFPHILLYGPDGAGKKTRLMCILRELYGPGVDNLKLENLSFQAPSGKKIEILVTTSLHHIEVNPSDVGVYDRVIVQGLIKQSAQSLQLNSNKGHDFKVIVIAEAEDLSKDAQHALRRTMEKYVESCRIILMSNSLSSIIDPIQSRCLCVRVSAPNCDEISEVLTKICNSENLKIAKDFEHKIYAESDRNLLRSIFMLESCERENLSIRAQKIQKPHWQNYIDEIASLIIQKQSAQQIMEIRGKFYELLSKCIPSNIIMKYLLHSLLPLCDDTIKHQAIQLAALYETRIRKGSKAIFHFEAFVCHFMAIYARFLEEGIAELFVD